MFGRKLDFLMHITDTSNSALATHLSLNPSYISRLRNGERKLPKDPDFLLPMSQYLARRISEDQQKNMLERMLRLDSGYPDKPEDQTEIILSWLSSDANNFSRVVGFARTYGKFENLINTDLSEKKPLGETVLFHGIEGKRKALHAFFDLVLNSKPGVFLYFSDENADWVFKDNETRRIFFDGFAALIRHGWKIKMIYTISMNINDLTNRAYAYIPLVITGAVERYYCTKVYNNVIRRTMCVIPELAAISSTSILEDVDGMPTLLTQDKKAVEGFTKEFNNYLNLCIPMGEVFSAPYLKNFWFTFRNFNDEPSDLFIRTRTISALSMPEEVALRVSQRVENPAFFDIYCQRKEKIDRYMEKNIVYDMITLPDYNQLIEGNVPFAFDDLISNGDDFYEPQDFLDHLQSVLDTMERFPNYRPSMCPDYMRDFSICIKEGYGYFLANHKDPVQVFYVNERAIVTGVWNQLMSFVSGDRKIEKQKVIDAIESYSAKLKALL